MTEFDADQIVYGLLESAKLIGPMPAHLFNASHLEWLIEAHDEIARAIEKARNLKEAA